MKTFTILLLALCILLGGIAPANAGIFGKKKSRTCAAYGRPQHSSFKGDQLKKVKLIRKKTKQKRSRYAISEKTGMPLNFSI